MGINSYGVEDNYKSGYQTTNGFVDMSGVNSQNNNTINGFNSMNNTGLQTAQTDFLNTQNDWYKQQMSNQNSFGSQMQPYMQGFANIAGGASSLASIYTGFQQLDLMDRQVGIAEEQWAETKSELTRVKGVRDKLNTSYMA